MDLNSSSINKFTLTTVLIGIIASGTTACATSSPTVSSPNSSPTNTQINNPTTVQSPNATPNLDNAELNKNNRQVKLEDPLSRAPDVNQVSKNGVPVPNISIGNISFIQTVLIPKTTSTASSTLDVTMLDDFIQEISPNARHYPPNFVNVSQKYNAKQKLIELEEWIRPFAEASNASYEVLLRAAKLNGMARNLDLGSDYTVRASNYVAKAIKRKPNSAEANFLYGMMLSEGGAFKESKKYLNKAVSLGYPEAEQSLAQADLLDDKRSAALTRLQRLQRQNPDDTIIPRQIKIIQSGDYYIWDLPVK